MVDIAQTLQVGQPPSSSLAMFLSLPTGMHMQDATKKSGDSQMDIFRVGKG